MAAIVGPTASGKTGLAIDVAARLGAEIVSVDSMQIYRGMNIGTATPTAEEQRGIRHHLLDLFDPSEDVSVSWFQALARAAIDDIAGRGRLPLLVGGSGLYYRAVVDDLSFPPRAPEVRARLEEEVDRLGAEELHRRLQDLDAGAAAKIEPSNARRTVRALEVIEITGRPFSSNDSWDRYESVYDLAVAGLALPRDRLFERIGERVDDMMSRGLVEEALAAERAGMGRTARQALGYRQILDSKEAPETALREEIVKATKRFARRQESWFKADPRIEWVDPSRPDAVDAVVGFFRSSLRLP